jgi:hypothetical protein
VRQRGRRLGHRWQAGGDGGAALKVEDDEQAGMETRVALEVEDDRQSRRWRREWRGRWKTTDRVAQ